MAFIYADRIMDTSVSSGTGSMVVSGTPALSWRTFSTACAVGDTFYYTIVDPVTGAWETGEGTYSAANTVARTTFRASSTSAPVSFAANAKSVFLDVIGYYFNARIPGTYLPIANPAFTGTMTGPALTLSGNILVNGNATIAGGNTNITGGNLYVDRLTDATAALVSLRADPGQTATYYIQSTGGLNRWIMQKTATAEAGSNVGSDFLIYAYDDAGAGIGSALTITRSTRLATFGAAITAAGNIFSSGAITAAGGNLLVDRTGDAASSYVEVRADSGMQGALLLRTGSVNRWLIGKDQTAEVSPTNVGSNFLLYAYDDVGAGLGTVFSVVRSTRVLSFAVAPSAPGLTLTGAFSGTTATLTGGLVAGAGIFREGAGSGVTPQTFHNNLVVDSDGSLGMAFTSPNTQTPTIAFGDPEDNDAGLISYTHSTDTMGFVTAGASRLTINATAATFAGDVISTSGTGALTASGVAAAQTSIFLYQPGMPTDQKTWEFLSAGTTGTFTFRSINDTYAASAGVFTVTRGALHAVGTMTITPPLILSSTLSGTTAAFSGEITAATAVVGDNDTTVATTAWVKLQSYATTASLGSYLPLTGGTLSGGLSGTTATFTADVLKIMGSATPRLLINNTGGGNVTYGMSNAGDQLLFSTWNSGTGALIANLVSMNTSGALTGAKATFIDNSNNIEVLIVQGTGTYGANLKLVGNGATTPNKTIRANDGYFDIINSAYNAVPFRLTDAGALSLTGALTAGNTSRINGSDGAFIFGVSGATRGVRIGANSAGGIIDGVDQTLTTSYQPLTFTASRITFNAPTFLFNNSFILNDGYYVYTPFNGATDTGTVRAGFQFDGTNQAINFYTANTYRGGMSSTGSLSFSGAMTVNGAMTVGGTLTTANDDTSSYGLTAGRFSAGFARVAMNTRGAYGWAFQCGNTDAFYLDPGGYGRFGDTVAAGRIGVSAAWGSSQLTTGGASNSGYVAFFQPDNTRVGYIGFADSSNVINYINDKSSYHRFVGAVHMETHLRINTTTATLGTNVKLGIRGNTAGGTGDWFLYCLDNALAFKAGIREDGGIYGLTHPTSAAGTEVATAGWSRAVHGPGSSFSAVMTAVDQTVAAGGGWTVQGYGEHYDATNSFNVTTGAWTPSVTGYYRVTGFCTMSVDTNPGPMRCGLYRSSSGHWLVLAYATSNISQTATWTIVTRCVAGETYIMHTENVSSTGGHVYGSSLYTGFTASFVGP